MSESKITRMANQIASFFVSQSGDQAAAVAAHISDNWAPPMRAELLAQVAAGGEGLAPLVIAAAPMVRPVSRGA
ncbi:formate dehydrogenase subunit delta [Phaeovulum sp. W22_SRMD_FR3]|uniref:formate dehydrogenase subunit delta n=1 Tax=Phaeovulum sp. W22_SRMD_FR3 TaxID=3240274 RepID=UPI003F946316